MISFVVATMVMLDLLTLSLARFCKWAVSGSVVGMALAAELGFTLPGGFGAGYSSMRIHLPPFAMRVVKFSSVLSLPGGFISGLMSSLTSGSTIASIPGVFFRVVATGVGRGACCCPFLLPCTHRFLGLGPVSVVTRKFLFLGGVLRYGWSRFAIVCGGREGAIGMWISMRRGIE